MCHNEKSNRKEWAKKPNKKSVQIIVEYSLEWKLLIARQKQENE